VTIVSDELWGPIDVSRWNSVAVIRDRLATEDDVRAGRAVFYLQDAVAPDAGPLPLDLPSLAVLRDDETLRDIVVVVIQGERSFAKKLVGYRLPYGGNGIALLEQLEWIDASDARVTQAWRPESRPAAG
jgi:hypothetical protein